MSDGWAILSALAGSAAAGAAGAAAWMTARTANATRDLASETKDLAERTRDLAQETVKMVGIESDRRADEVQAKSVADVRGWFEGHSNAAYFMLENRGPARAEDVTIVRPSASPVPAQDARTLDPGARWKIGTSSGAYSLDGHVITWTDLRGSGQEFHVPPGIQWGG